MNFAKPNVVSVWVGQFSDAQQFGDYIDWIYDADGNDRCRFAEHAGLGCFDHDAQEAEFLDEPTGDLKQFINGFSYAPSFEALLCDTLTTFVTPWNSILLLYDCAYDPGRAHPSKASRLHFVGSVPYENGSAFRVTSVT